MRNSAALRMAALMAGSVTAMACGSVGIGLGETRGALLVRVGGVCDVVGFGGGGAGKGSESTTGGGGGGAGEVVAKLKSFDCLGSVAGVVAGGGGGAGATTGGAEGPAS